MSNKLRENVTSQKIHSIEIKKLKGILNLKPLSFEPNFITVILGPNGCGKSTILHALAAVYMPVSKKAGENFKLIDFFPASPDSIWNGSNFKISISYRNENGHEVNEETYYGKGEEKGSRWYKRYSRRPKREIYYMGIDQCVPVIESEKKSNISYVTSEVPPEFSEEILSTASQILNKKYKKLNKYIQPNGKV